MKLRWKKGTAGEQHGAFIVFTALMLWFLMMFVAFSVDFGNYYQHRSRLQNAADAAALAGVAEYTTEEIAKNTGAVNAPALSKGRIVTLVENDKAVSASRTVRDQAQEYVKNNYREIEIKDNKVWSEEVTEETTENGVKRNTTTTHRYCRVDLEDTVQTFFARIFGVDSLTVKVSALAMMDGSADDETWGKRFVGIAERMEMLAPNQIWESLINGTDRTKAFSIIDPNPNKSSTGNVGFGSGKNRYYVVTGVAAALLGQEKARIKHDYGNGIVIGYTDPKPGDKDYGICAKEIHLDPGISWETLLSRDDELRESSKGKSTNNVDYRRCCPTTKIFNIADNQGVTTNNGKAIVALYLNRDHITNDDNDKRSGLTDRFTEINVGCITGTTENTGEDKKSYVLPLYARLESEPIRIGTGRALMPVHGVTVNVNAEQVALGMHEEKGKIKFDETVKPRPFVLAYDGPDPNRGEIMTNKADPCDAPWIATRATDLNVPETSFDDYKNTKRDYAPAEIRQYFEPLLTNGKFKYNMYRSADGVGASYLNDHFLVESALKTSGPIYVNISPGCVLYGAIYAPHSKVILNIEPNGFVYGFIIARQIEFALGSKRTAEYHKDSSSLPVLAAIIKDRDKSIFDYERKYVTGNYEIAFDYYEDFTDAKYYSSVIQ